MNQEASCPCRQQAAIVSISVFKASLLMVNCQLSTLNCQLSSP